MTRWKQILWWLAVGLIVAAGVVASIPPSNPSRVVLWLTSIGVFLVCLPVLIWLDRERRRAAARPSDFTPSKPDE
jgi:cytochrome c-type biogenesis protein CcmH/NrfF